MDFEEHSSLSGFRSRNSTLNWGLKIDVLSLSRVAVSFLFHETDNIPLPQYLTWGKNIQINTYQLINLTWELVALELELQENQLEI